MGFENGNDSTGTIQIYLIGGVDSEGKVRAIAVSNNGGIGGGGDGSENASAENQVVGNETLASIDEKTPILGANTAANSQPVTLANDGIFAIFAGLASDAASINGSIHAKLRAIASSLVQGQALMAASVPVAIASDQSRIPVSVVDGLVVTGSSTGLGVLFSQNTAGYQSVSIQVTSIGIATIVYEDSDDGTTWYSLVGYDSSFAGAISPSSTATALQKRIFPVFGRFFRARVSAYTSGTVSVAATFRTFPFWGSVSVQQNNPAYLNTNATCLGTTGHNNSIAYAPLLIAKESRTTQRSATGDATVSRPIVDKLGRTVVKRGHIRELQDINTLTLSNTTETTLIAAPGAGIFNDITDLIISNTSAMTAARLDIRDSNGGIVRLSLWIPAASTLPPISLAGVAKQSTANNAWTAQLSVAVTDVRITAISERTA